MAHLIAIACEMDDIGFAGGESHTILARPFNTLFVRISKHPAVDFDGPGNGNDIGVIDVGDTMRALGEVISPDFLDLFKKGRTEK